MTNVHITLAMLPAFDTVLLDFISKASYKLSMYNNELVCYTFYDNDYHY